MLKYIKEYNDYETIGYLNSSFSELQFEDMSRLSEIFESYFKQEYIDKYSEYNIHTRVIVKTSNAESMMISTGVDVNFENGYEGSIDFSSVIHFGDTEIPLDIEVSLYDINADMRDKIKIDYTNIKKLVVETPMEYFDELGKIVDKFIPKFINIAL